MRADTGGRDLILSRIRKVFVQLERFQDRCTLLSFVQGCPSMRSGGLSRSVPGIGILDPLLQERNSVQLSKRVLDSTEGGIRELPASSACKWARRVA
jgi:hypothetical protein